MKIISPKDDKELRAALDAVYPEYILAVSSLYEGPRTEYNFIPGVTSHMSMKDFLKGANKKIVPKDDREISKADLVKVSNDMGFAALTEEQIRFTNDTSCPVATYDPFLRTATINRDFFVKLYNEDTMLAAALLDTTAKSIALASNMYELPKAKKGRDLMNAAVSWSCLCVILSPPGPDVSPITVEGTGMFYVLISAITLLWQSNCAENRLLNHVKDSKWVIYGTSSCHFGDEVISTLIHREIEVGNTTKEIWKKFMGIGQSGPDKD